MKPQTCVPVCVPRKHVIKQPFVPCTGRRENCVGAATFSSSAATGSRKAESNNRMDGHEGNAAHRAATVAQARTGHGTAVQPDVARPNAVRFARY
ncbi:hypothetical protein [Streptomyces bicolor]|uniref:hypothetical protein n=1 Tax=Streptomyces bicolor TaxID=66874 RepID=UPI00131B7A33|nr:hypothetical protein [Streptomyces bicolor]